MASGASPWSTGHRQKNVRSAPAGAAVAARSNVYAEVRKEVAAAQADAAAAWRVELTADQLRSAEKGFRQDLDRQRLEVGRPVELVNSLLLLLRARAQITFPIPRTEIERKKTEATKEQALKKAILPISFVFFVALCSKVNLLRLFVRKP